MTSTDGNEVRDLNVAQLVNVPTEYSFGEILEHQQVVMFSVTGAWRQRHKVDDYQANAAVLKGLGVNKIVCHVVDNPWTVSAWAAWLNVPDIDFIADGNGALARRLGMICDMRVEEMGDRCWQYSCYIDNGTCDYWRQEDDFLWDLRDVPHNPDRTMVTTATDMIDWIQSS